MFTYLGISASIDHVPVYAYMHKHVKGVRYRAEVLFGTQISAARTQSSSYHHQTECAIKGTF